jgi:hypothetical protein
VRNKSQCKAISMNKRIRELADRAGEYADFESGLCTDEFLKKFAELIVRECANWIVDNAGTMDHLGPEHFAQAMKNTFGVEE